MSEIKRQHLSEADIQDYLDNRRIEMNGRPVREHLRTCSRCTEAVARYEQLYSGLKVESGFMMSANFSDAVMARLDAAENSRFDLTEIILMICAVIVGLGSLFYFVDVSAVLTAANDSYLTTWLEAVQSSKYVSAQNLLVFGGSFAVLLLFSWIDRLFLQTRHRHS